MSKDDIDNQQEYENEILDFFMEARDELLTLAPDKKKEVVAILTEVVEILINRGCYRSALDQIFSFLERYPDDDSFLRLSQVVLYTAENPHYTYNAKEPLTREYFDNDKLDFIFCECDNCHNTWIPNPLSSIYGARATITNPLGMYCPACKMVWCGECLSRGLSPLGVHVLSCPKCKGALSNIEKPNGRKPARTKKRKEKLETVLIFTEGPITPSAEKITKIIQALSPEILTEKPNIFAFPVFPWSKDNTFWRTKVASICVEKNIIPLLTETSFVYSKEDGSHICIVKNYTPSPEAIKKFLQGE